MAPVIATTVIKDGAGASITGGVQTLEISGNGTTGPFTFMNALVDGATGTTLATVKKANTTAVAGDTGVVVGIHPLSNAVVVSSGSVTAILSGNVTAIVTSQARAARNFVGTAILTTNFTALAANQAVQFLRLQNTHTSSDIACAFGVPALINSTSSLMLGPGESIWWGPTTAGVPSGALNCIASVTTAPLFIEWI